MNPLILKRMGVMNITPNSFSDGGELDSLEKFLARLAEFGKIEALDIGAESTAPTNESISHQEEWDRLKPYLSILKSLNVTLSIDSYHPETIFKFADEYKAPFIWNDISGKFDQDVENFLKRYPENHYVFCHNLAPSREKSGQHMSYISTLNGPDYLKELADYFLPFKKDRVIFDPCLGFSKTFEQNWFLLNHFNELQALVSHPEWLLGFSRKSFIRKKLGIENMNQSTKIELDLYHKKILTQLKALMSDTVWIRTHRPELVTLTSK